MLFKPAQLGLAKLNADELEADKKACKKIGPCGVGKKALYLNSFYIDRRYYLPYGSITRVFKREPRRLYRQGNVRLHGLSRGGVRRRQAEAVQLQG